METTAKPSASDRIYKPIKLAAVVEKHREEGVSPKEALRGADELYSPEPVISSEQLLAARL